MIKAWIVVIMALLAVAPAQAMAWEYIYDGSVRPTDPSLGGDAWGTYSSNDFTQTSASDGILRVKDTSVDAYAYYSRFAVGYGSPLTLEARVRVMNGNGTALVAGSPSFYTFLWLSADRIDVNFVYGSQVSYPVDLTTFRRIRVATDSQGQSLVWVDGNLIAQGETNTGNQGDVQFGSESLLGTNESHWDYVAYSAEFLPVPEPSSILALGFGALGTLCVGLTRRARTIR